MRATTLRSNQIAMSTLVSRNTTMATALISQIQHVSLLKSAVDRGPTARAARRMRSRAAPRDGRVAVAAARRTTSPGVGVQGVADTALPTAFVGSHTTWSGIVGDDRRAA